MTDTRSAELANAVTAFQADVEDVDRLVSGLDAAGWTTPTPAPGWTVAHQIAHLAATFRLAGLAAADPQAFVSLTSRLSADFTANVTAALQEYLREPPAVLLGRWREECAAAARALAAAPAHEPLPWLVRPIPPAVLACAGMMELFGHGQDIADALGVTVERTDRIRWLAGFAVRTWDFGYQARGLPTPQVSFRYELTAPSGATWTFGPDDAGQSVTGPAVDLCLLVTRRRHRDDLGLRASGPDADAWLDIAQAYRGPAGPGRRPGQFAAGVR
ncbi:TIGR03084 family metal-binding protein [Actinoplanes siamensis]|uniref:Wyosine base formation n=1 Tax=Actinoplanes siamensis TaxID=1223317 RepID=A0A919TM85_9ACTN|nr:TIGR03084 family metal-binding protein [Actinoplanes siamensis]GIF07013.1 wyosine base formation [Actinoplanes siamensis]